jgi:hypothetical protein
MAGTFSTGTIRHRQIAGFSGTRQRNRDDKLQLQWIVLGAENEMEAEAYLIGEGLPPNEIDFRLLGDSVEVPVRLIQYTWKEAGQEGAYIFTADYSFNFLENDEWRLQISTGGGTIRMTSSFGTTRYAPPGRTAPDYRSAIDVQDGKPQGVDRVIPATKMTLTYRLQRPADPFAFAALSDSLVGTFNSAPMLGKAAGELLYLGGDGNFGNKIDPEMQFSWAASVNATISIGSIVDIEKKGHDYLWLIYEDEQTGEGDDTHVVTKPRAAYVERIYTEADHSLLGLLLS